MDETLAALGDSSGQTSGGEPRESIQERHAKLECHKKGECQ